MLLMSSMLISMLISMLLMSDSSARLLILWFELVHPIHGSADRIFRWVHEQSLMQKYDSYSMFVWNLECTFKTCKSQNKNLLVYNGLVHLPDTPTLKWTRPLLYIRPAKDPIPVFKWRSSRKHLSSLQQGCTVARYVTNHFQGRTICLATCSFIVRKGSKAVIVQNVTANKGNWKSTPFVIT